MNNISKKYDKIIEEKLGNNLLNASYNYFKNKSDNILPKELNKIKEQWKIAYEEVYNDINLIKKISNHLFSNSII